MSLRLPLMLVLLSFSLTLQAQSEQPPHFQLYGGYSWLSNTFNGVPGARKPLNGWDSAIAFQEWHKLRFKIDVSGYRGTNLNAPQHALILMGGGQYNVQIGRETLFGEGLFGDAGLNENWGANKGPGNTASVAAVAGGGLDTRLTRHLAFRAEADYQYSYFALVTPGSKVPYRIPGLPTNFGRTTGGLVYLF